MNHSIGSLQFNSETEALPENYAEIAARHVALRPTASPLLISEPNTMIGKNVYSPRRWYVCVRGIAPKGNPSTIIPLTTRIENWLSPPASTDHYDIIVVFQEKLNSFVTEGFDSRLCRNAQFLPLSI